MDQKLEEKINSRQKANRHIVKVISDMVEGSPDLRFHQILHTLGIVRTEMINAPNNIREFELMEQGVHVGKKQVCKDLFYEESVDTLRFMGSANTLTDSGDAHNKS